MIGKNYKNNLKKMLIKHFFKPESQTLLAEERVSAVAGSEGEDVAGGRDVSDQSLLGVARPFCVLLARGKRLSDRVETPGNDQVTNLCYR